MHRVDPGWARLRVSGHSPHVNLPDLVLQRLHGFFPFSGASTIVRHSSTRALEDCPHHESARGIVSLEDLRGKTVALGAKDSPQATLIPLRWLQRHGLEPGRDFRVRGFDVLVGKHGDHVGGELEAFRCLARGEADASALLDLNWERWTRDGTIDPHAYRILTTTAPFDHCCFTVRADFPPEHEQDFLRVLFAMRYGDPKHREMMDLEGLKAWVPGRSTGYALLKEAVARQGVFATPPA